MFTSKDPIIVDFDAEWLVLILKARDLGLTKEQIRIFLYEKSKLVYDSLLGTQAVSEHE